MSFHSDIGLLWAIAMLGRSWASRSQELVLPLSFPAAVRAGYLLGQDLPLFPRQVGW